MMDRFDRAVLIIIAVMAVLIGGVILLGPHGGQLITATIPADGDSAPAAGPIRVQFATGMNSASVEDRFMISPDVPGTLTWAGVDTLIFTPDGAFPPGEPVTVRLDPGFETAGGRASNRAYAWTFTARDARLLALYPADVAVQSLVQLALDGSEPLTVFEHANGILDFAPAPDGSAIAVVITNDDNSNDIWLIDADGSNPRAVTACAPALCLGPEWSPDSTTLAYQRHDQTLDGTLGPSRVWLLDVASGETAQVYEDNQVLGFGPSFSPGGTKLAFFDGSEGVIRVLDLVTGDAVLIPSKFGEVGVFSPDGAEMLFVDVELDGIQFYAKMQLADLTSDEGLISPLLDDPQQDQWPAWSPDGEWIVFSRRPVDSVGRYGGQVTLYNTASGELTQVTDNTDYNHLDFYWDPAGARVVFLRYNLTGTYPQPQVLLLDLTAGDLEPQLVIENAHITRWAP